MRWYGFAMDQNYSSAFYGAGILNQLGLGTKKNIKEAIRLYTESSAKGHRIAPYMMGQLHETGTGVPKNRALAIRWYRVSAKRKYAKAAARLSKMTGQNPKTNS